MGHPVSLFRTQAWVQSWLDVWGNDPRITLIDLGGRGEPREYVYLLKHTLKGLVPVTSLVLAGNGHANFTPPRAEYNDLNSLVRLTGGVESLIEKVCSLVWNQWVISDFIKDEQLDEVLAILHRRNYRIQSKWETTYRINAAHFHSYKKSLSSSTRKKYFSDRQRLEQYGSVMFTDITCTAEFLTLINRFHQSRWGRNCYSADSMKFIELFVSRIQNEGGKPVMQLMQISGEPASVLFDIEWNGTRYNLQAGYLERKFSNLALGSLHLGFAIEYSINNGLIYDLLAGNGKNTDYKKRIATEQKSLLSAVVTRGWLKALHQLYDIRNHGISNQ